MSTTNVENLHLRSDDDDLEGLLAAVPPVPLDQDEAVALWTAWRAEHPPPPEGDLLFDREVTAVLRRAMLDTYGELPTGWGDNSQGMNHV